MQQKYLMWFLVVKYQHKVLIDIFMVKETIQTFAIIYNVIIIGLNSYDIKNKKRN